VKESGPLFAEAVPERAGKKKQPFREGLLLIFQVACAFYLAFALRKAASMTLENDSTG